MKKIFITLLFLPLFSFSQNFDVAAEHFEKGTNYYDNQQYSLALFHFNKSISELNDNMKSALTMVLQKRAATYSALEQFDNAIDDFSKCIKLNPSDATNYFLRGHAKNLKINNYGPGCSDFKEACRLGSKDACGELPNNCQLKN